MATKNSNSGRFYRGGFTLTEFLMALVVMSIILAAVATLAFALGNAEKATQNMEQYQKQLRYATLRIQELVRNSLCVWQTPANNFIVWTRDANSNLAINACELVFIRADNTAKKLYLLEDPTQMQAVSIASIKSGLVVLTVFSQSSVKTATLVSNCANIQMSVGGNKYVGILFDLTEGGVVTSYQICAYAEGGIEPFINSSGELVASDDD